MILEYIHMKKVTILILALSFALSIQSQDNNDILIGVSIPEVLGYEGAHISESATKLLRNRLFKIVTSSGVSGNLTSPRFFLLPSVVVLNKEILATAPPTIVLNLELTLFVGDSKEEKGADNIEGKGHVFQTTQIEIKGIGKNEQKAYINAFRNLKSKSSKLNAFVEDVKVEIVQYYEQNCDIITKKAYALKAQKEMGDAVKVIANIPLSSKCYAENEKSIGRLYQDFLQQECESLLNQARASWYSNQSIYGAKEAAKKLEQIAPRAYCKKEILKLYKEIAEGVSKIQGERFEFKMKKLDVKVQKDNMKFMRELTLKSLERNPSSISGAIFSTN